MELKRAKIVMLPTNEGIVVNTRVEPNGKGHLYFTTDEEIKESDWIFDSDEKIVHQADSKERAIYWNNVNSRSPEFHFRKKIIASTDPKLILHCNKGEQVTNLLTGKNYLFTKDLAQELHLGSNKLPQPSQAFIEKYCKLGGIDEVDVEYGWKCCSYGNECSFPTNHKKDFADINILAPKVDSHNTITTRQVKDNYSKEEIVRVD